MGGPGTRALSSLSRRPPLLGLVEQGEVGVEFHGFDAPTEYSAAPSPRHALSSATDYLPAALRPESVRDLDTLLGDDTDWTNPAAMYDPAAPIGDSDRARALRIVADDLASTLRRAAPGLHPTDPTGYVHALAHTRTAQGLLRYHAAMAGPAPDRIATMLSLRAEMMADNLLAIVTQEQPRGPSLLFAHNAHLQRAQSPLPVGEDDASWGSAGAALPPSTGTGEPIVPGHLPLNPAELDGTDAVIFIADTDGKRHQYW